MGRRWGKKSKRGSTRTRRVMKDKKMKEKEKHILHTCSKLFHFQLREVRRDDAEKMSQEKSKRGSMSRRRVMEDENVEKKEKHILHHLFISRCEK